MTTLPPVSIVRCNDYDASLDAAVNTLLAQLGGLSALIPPNANVLIKPNLLTDRDPADAVTTHPEIIRAVIRQLRAIGARPSVGDCSFSALNHETIWRKTGIQELCRQEQVPLLNLEQQGLTTIDADGFSLQVSNAVLQADAVINIAKAKTHVFTLLTAAVKNLYGVLPGYQKMALHKTHPSPREFGRLLLALARKIAPALNIVDAVIGMDGDGPSAGRPVHCGFIAASADPVALDVAVCACLGIKPANVPYLRLAASDNPLYRDHTGLTVRGCAPTDIQVPSFRQPSTLRNALIPWPILKLIAPLLWIRPTFSALCIRCERCVKACPAHALTLASSQTLPTLQPQLCVGCCCCHEICPAQAITLRQSPLLRALRAGKPLA